MRNLTSKRNTRGGNGRIFGSLVGELQQRLNRGEWQPGEHLPSITHLAHTFGVSTGSVREALRSLQSQGYVRIEHGRGVIVISTHGSTGSESPQCIDIEHVIALGEARRLIEPELAALAAERGSDNEIAEIREQAITMEQQALRGTDFVGPDVAFHRAIAQAAHNPVLQHMLNSTHELFLASRHLTSQEQGMTERTIRYHRLIADAIYERNASQARLLMLAHMNDALSSIRILSARRAHSPHDNAESSLTLPSPA
jgi:GntR family transcriptional repressor for pyruvate dehydrogenase complex